MTQITIEEQNKRLKEKISNARRAYRDLQRAYLSVVSLRDKYADQARQNWKYYLEVSEGLRQEKDTTKRLADKIIEKKDNPWKTFSIAVIFLSLGYLLGILWH